MPDKSNSLSMWERKTKRATWEGLPFNILSTSLDNGKRLQVVELPYADEPLIKVMGSKTKGISLEAVFVGKDSLSDANTFISKLESNPIGKLEHPFLGELSLVYQTSTQSFATKQGLVNLSLKFILQSKVKKLVLQADSNEKPTSKLTADIKEVSSKQFIKDIETATPEQIKSIQEQFTTALSKIKLIANKITEPAMKLSRLHREIQDAFSAIRTIVNAPQAFVDAVELTFKSLGDEISGLTGNKKTFNGNNSKTNNKSFASKELMKAIDLSNTSTHCNILIVCSIVSISDELKLAKSEPELDTLLIVQENNSLELIVNNIEKIKILVNDLINEATRAANFETLALVDALQELETDLVNQKEKVNKLLLSLKVASVPSALPLLCIAHSNETQEKQISAINKIKHPLFVKGILRIPNE